MTEIKVRVKFLEELLGTTSNNPAVHDEFIASKAPDAPSRAEEVAAIGVKAEIEKSMTVFPRLEDGTPFIWDYQWRGFFKEACSILSRIKSPKSKFKSNELKAYKKTIDGLVFIKERKIPLIFDGEMGNCQRPLRASTVQGERIALSNSETVPEGAECEFTIVCLDDSLVKYVKEWMDYGYWHGMLQWRNSGKGRFEWSVVK